MPEFAGRHAPELARNLNIDARGLFEAAAFHQAYGRIDDGFRREAVALARFKSEDVARQMNCADLAPSIRKQSVGPNRAADDLIDVFGRLVLTVDRYENSEATRPACPVRPQNWSGLANGSGTALVELTESGTLNVGARVFGRDDKNDHGWSRITLNGGIESAVPCVAVSFSVLLR